MTALRLACPAARHGERSPAGTGPGSDGGERVVAELGQDVAGLADELAGLRQGGDLAVGAVLDGRVVVVAGGRRAAVGLAGLIGHPAQDLRALPGQVPGRALAVGGIDGDIQPANRTALREEENRPAPPSQQVIARPASGPTPYSRACSARAPARCRAACSSCWRSVSIRASIAASMSSAVATCSCPAGDR